MLRVHSKNVPQLVRAISTSKSWKFPRKPIAERVPETNFDDSAFKWKQFVKTPLSKSETFIPTEFGNVRFDSQNIPKVHGEFDDNSKSEAVTENTVEILKQKPDLQQDVTSFFLENDHPAEKIPEFIPKTGSKLSTYKDEEEPVRRAKEVPRVDHSPRSMEGFKYVKQLRTEAIIRRAELESSNNTRLSKEVEVSQLGQGLQSKLQRAFILDRPRNDKAESTEESEATQSYLCGKLHPKFLPFDLSKLTSTEVITQLQKTVIYNDNDIVAINKLYGLEMFGDNIQHSVEKYLPALAEFVGCEKLHQVHRLDKVTSGLLLLAKSEGMHQFLSALFRKRKIHKTYWTITNGTPNPQAGIIKIPLAESCVDGRFRITVVPDYKAHSDLTGDKKKVNLMNASHYAVTEYSTVKAKGNAALLEIHPVTGFKHQIRAHLGFGLGAPVLADHKFSSIKFDGRPQKVHGDILRKLKVRESRSRDLPILLHAKSIKIPDVLSNRDIYLKAKLPFHFVKIMKALGLNPK